MLIALEVLEHWSALPLDRYFRLTALRGVVAEVVAVIH